MNTISHKARIAKLRTARDRCMKAARVARALGCADLKEEMVDNAKEQQFHILRAKRQATAPV